MIKAMRFLREMDHEWEETQKLKVLKFHRDRLEKDCDINLIKESLEHFEKETEAFRDKFLHRFTNELDNYDRLAIKIIQKWRNWNPYEKGLYTGFFVMGVNTTAAMNISNPYIGLPVIIILSGLMLWISIPTNLVCSSENVIE